MKLLQIPVANLEQRIKEELQENPALEEGQEHDEDEYRADTEGEAEDDNNDDEELERTRRYQSGRIPGRRRDPGLQDLG